jgi:glycosyltransferase involved in cell wall biosynthesis
MPAQPEISLLVSSFERPGHLRRALLSIAVQQGVAGKFEVVVTDDGSDDDTPQMVRDFAATVDFPLRFITHPHDAFQLSRCRNEGVQASTAPYILFLDGDCLLPPDHVAIHLARREPGVAQAGHFARIDEANSARIGEAEIRSGQFMRMAMRGERLVLLRLHLKARFYEIVRHPRRPKLHGNNVGVWRSDYELVNGYDEDFVGWGGEDYDLAFRLRRAGVRIKSILGHTYGYHLWHPLHVTRHQCLNYERIHRVNPPIRCLNGLVKERAAAA